ncbi:MAG TPA: hypothetical protein VNM16_05770 [Bacillota bacterium]|nr:hypothetical protein [Bacillota bacterium]
MDDAAADDLTGEATGAETAMEEETSLQAAETAAPEPDGDAARHADGAAQGNAANGIMAEGTDHDALASGAAWAADGAPAGEAEAAATASAEASLAEPVPLASLGPLLGLSPYALRSLLDEFADVVPVDGRVPGQPGLLPDDVERLRQIAGGHAQGLAHDEIRRRLELGADAPPMADALLDRMEQLQAELAQSERRRVEDRDRLLLALVRTQQEIQHLRYEMTGTRRSKRKGFWARLFGR